jgi:hypothetical protein
VYATRAPSSEIVAFVWLGASTLKSITCWPVRRFFSQISHCVWMLRSNAIRDPSRVVLARQVPGPSGRVYRRSTFFGWLSPNAIRSMTRSRVRAANAIVPSRAIVGSEYWPGPEGELAWRAGDPSGGFGYRD